MIIKTTAQININFMHARQQADKLDRAASAIRREGKNFNNCRNDVAASSTGDNAARFTNKMGMVAEDLEKIARNLEQTASVIRKNAKTIYDAEMEAKRIAEARKVN
jgi:uncharacterized protein YukE